MARTATPVTAHNNEQTTTTATILILTIEQCLIGPGIQQLTYFITQNYAAAVGGPPTTGEPPL